MWYPIHCFLEHWSKTFWTLFLIIWPLLLWASVLTLIFGCNSSHIKSQLSTVFFRFRAHLVFPCFFLISLKKFLQSHLSSCSLICFTFIFVFLPMLLLLAYTSCVCSKRHFRVCCVKQTPFLLLSYYVICITFLSLIPFFCIYGKVLIFSQIALMLMYAKEKSWSHRNSSKNWIPFVSFIKM